MRFKVSGPNIGVIANGVTLQQALTCSRCWIVREPAGIIVEVDTHEY